MSFNFNSLVKDLQLEILKWIPITDIVHRCSLVCKGWMELCNSNIVWRQKILELLKDNYQPVNLDSHFLKQEFQLLYEERWSETAKHASIVLTNSGRTAFNSDHQAGSSNWRTVVGHKPLLRGKRIWHVHIDRHAGAYPQTIVGVGLVSNRGVRLEVDLSGTSPSISYFASGRCYTYPTMKNSNSLSNLCFSTYSTGTLISYCVDLDTGEVTLSCGGKPLISFELPQDLRSTPWYIACTLAGGSQATIYRRPQEAFFF